MKKLKSLQLIESGQRNSTIDIFRAIAIISVVLFHFNNFLPYGHVGVDLFFVISGLLIGGLLIHDIGEGKQIRFFRFILQRGFKIWPSYYSFIIVGNIAAYFLLSTIAPDQYIPLWDIKRYIFFYQNYTGQPFHWSFDHVWSLCVEEHFYIMLPILFIVIQRSYNDRRVLLSAVCLVIVAGILFKYLALIYTNSKDTYSGTHNRIDALAWGVLLSIIINFYPELMKRISFVIGLLLFIAAMWMEINLESVIYHKVIFHSFLPICFFLMISGLYDFDFSRLKWLRLIAYYSYNWYLWHPIFAIGINYLFGNTITGLLVYAVASFVTAIIFTVIVEEPFLEMRKKVIPG